MSNLKELFKGYCFTSVSYGAHIADDSNKAIQKEVKRAETRAGKPMLNATWATNGKMTVNTKDKTLTFENMTEKEYDLFWKSLELI